MNRKKLESFAWRFTHANFKGKRADGTRCVLQLIPNEGTCSVPLASLTIPQLMAKIPKAELGRALFDDDAVYAIMKAASAEHGWPKGSYRRDLRTHDRAFLKRHDGGAFGWVLYHNGTHIHRKADPENLREVRNARDVGRAFASGSMGDHVFYVFDGVQLDPARKFVQVDYLEWIGILTGEKLMATGS